MKKRIFVAFPLLCLALFSCGSSNQIVTEETFNTVLNNLYTMKNYSMKQTNNYKKVDHIEEEEVGKKLSSDVYHISVTNTEEYCDGKYLYHKVSQTDETMTYSEKGFTKEVTAKEQRFYWNKNTNIFATYHYDTEKYDLALISIFDSGFGYLLRSVPKDFSLYSFDSETKTYAMAKPGQSVSTAWRLSIQNDHIVKAESSSCNGYVSSAEEIEDKATATYTWNFTNISSTIVDVPYSVALIIG